MAIVKKESIGETNSVKEIIANEISPFYLYSS